MLFVRASLSVIGRTALRRREQRAKRSPRSAGLDPGYLSLASRCTDHDKVLVTGGRRGRGVASGV